MVCTIAQGTELRRAQAGNIERVVAHEGGEAVMAKRAGSNA
jgi:hypothetical protein